MSNEARLEEVEELLEKLDENSDFIWMKSVGAGDETIEAFVASITSLLGYLKAAQGRGFVLEYPVDNGHVYLIDPETRTKKEALQEEYDTLAGLTE